MSIEETLRRIASTSVAQFLARGITFASSIVSVPLIVNAYGLSSYGAYAIVLSFSTFLFALDSGVGGELRRAATVALAFESDLDVRAFAYTYRRSVWKWILSASALAFALVAVIPWQVFIPESALSRPALTLAAFSAIYLFGLRVQIYTRSLEGVGGQTTAALLSIGPGLLTLLLTVVGVAATLPLAVLALVPALFPMLHGLASRLYLGLRKPKDRTATPDCDRHIGVTLPLTLTLISLAHASSYNLDYLLVGAVLGGTETGTFAAVAKLGQLFLLIASASGVVLWSHFAVHRMDLTNERTFLLRRMVGAGILVAIPFALVAPYAAHYVLLGEQASLEDLFWLSAGFSVWGCIMIAHQPLAMAANSVANLRLQALSMLAMTIVNVPLSIVALHVIGVSGSIWASATSLLMIHVPALLWLTRRSDRSAAIAAHSAHQFTGDDLE